MNSETSNIESKPSKLRLFLVVICANILSFTIGTGITWPSPMMPKLINHSEDSPLDAKIDLHQAGWIFSVISIGAGVSAIIAGPLVDRIGRKPMLIIYASTFTLAYILLVVARHIEIIYIARILQGMGAGGTMTVMPMYIGEIATKESRGSCLTIMTLFMTLGMLFVFCTGPYTTYVMFQSLCLTLPVMAFAGITFIPESPYYLVKKKRADEAIKSLQKVRKQEADMVKNELKDIEEAVERAESITQGRWADLVINPGNRRALITVLGLAILQQFSGVVVIIINAQSIFIQADSSLDPALATIIIGIVQVIASVALQLIVDWYKRRTLLKLSATGMCISQLATGTYFYIKATGDASQMRWIPILAFILFQLSYRIGFGPLPFAMMGELFAPNVKSKAVTSIIITCWGLGFLVARFYPLFDALGSHFVFWTFSVLCGFAILFTHFVVIETHGLSLKEIQERLQKIK